MVRRPTYLNDARLYSAVTFRPFGQKGGTTLRLHYETGKINGSPPSRILPVENLSRFLNQPDLFPALPDVARVSINPVEFARQYGRNEGPYFNVETSPTLRDLAIRSAYALRFDGSGRGGINPLAFYGQVQDAQNANGNAYFDPNRIGSPNQDYVFNGNKGEILRTATGNAAWANQGFVNLDTFNFSKYNLGWDSQWYKNSFTNYNVALEQLFLRNTAGINVSFDHQSFDRASYTVGPDPDGAGAIALDINTHMLFPTQEGGLVPAPNPNFGRPVMMTRRFNTHEFSDTTRQTARATLFYKLNLAERDDWMKWLGNHTFTVLADREEQDIFRHGSRPSSFDGSFRVVPTLPGASTDPTIFSRDIPFMMYLGPPQLNAFTNPNFQLKDFVLTANNGYDLSFDSIAGEHATMYWDIPTQQWKRGTFTVREIPQRDPNLQKVVIESQALNLSSEFFHGNLIVNTGYRKDRVKDAANRTPPRDSDNIPIVMDRSRFNLQSGNVQRAEASKSIFAWGAVGSLPKRWNPLSRWLNVSAHYNQSDNFVPVAGQNTPQGIPLPSPAGKSKDYGVSFNLFQNKVIARLNWYEGRLDNSSESNFDLFLNQVYTTAFAFLGNLNQNIVSYNNPANDRSRYPRINEARQAYAEMETLLRAQGNLWERKQVSFLADGSISQITVNNIGDTTSRSAKGFEAEVILNPTPGWRIALNAAKQQAVLDNYMPGLTAFYANFLDAYVAKWVALETRWSAIRGPTANSHLALWHRGFG